MYSGCSSSSSDDDIPFKKRKVAVHQTEELAPAPQQSQQCHSCHQWEKMEKRLMGRINISIDTGTETNLLMKEVLATKAVPATTTTLRVKIVPATSEEELNLLCNDEEIVSL